MKNKLTMDKNEKDLQEQEAPLKNTDKAFVKVNEDGSPKIPEVKENEEKKEGERITTLDHR